MTALKQGEFAPVTPEHAYFDSLTAEDRKAYELTYGKSLLADRLEEASSPAEFAVVFAAQQRRALGRSQYEKEILHAYRPKAQAMLLNGGDNSYLMSEVAERVAGGSNVSSVDLQLVAWSLDPPHGKMGLRRLKEYPGDVAFYAVMKRATRRNHLGSALSAYARARHGWDISSNTAKLRALIEHDILWQSGVLKRTDPSDNDDIRDAHLGHFVGVVKSVRAEHLGAVQAAITESVGVEVPHLVIGLSARAEDFLRLREGVSRGSFPADKYSRPSLIQDAKSARHTPEYKLAYKEKQQESNQRYLALLDARVSLVPQLVVALHEKKPEEALELWAVMTNRMLFPRLQGESRYLQGLRADVCHLVEPYLHQQLELIRDGLAPLAVLQAAVDGLRPDRCAAQVNTDDYGLKIEDKIAYSDVMHDLWEKRGIRGSNFRLDSLHLRMTAEYVFCQELARQDPNWSGIIHERMRGLYTGGALPVNLPHQVQKAFVAVCLRNDAAGWAHRRHNWWSAALARSSQ